MWLVGLGVLAVAIAYKVVRRGKKEELHVKDWKEGVVYLIQLPVTPNCRTISPFALKLETWLRLAKIKYETRYSMKFGVRGQTPYIELDGQQYPDSNLIMDMLRERNMGVDPEKAAGVSQDASKLALSHMARIMLENHTTLFGFLWRYGTRDKLKEFVDKMFVNYTLPRWWPATALFEYSFTRSILKKYRLVGIARHTEEQRLDLSCRDFKALEDASLAHGDKFYLGTSEPTSIDCVLFAHLVQFLLIPMDFPQKPFLENECPNLVGLVEKVKTRLWPDFEKMSDAECMEGLWGLK